MVLQYKGFDGLWKCLLNSKYHGGWVGGNWVVCNVLLTAGSTNAGDDSLRRILRQGIKSQTMLQMRVPREQDLLSVSLISMKHTHYGN